MSTVQILNDVRPGDADIAALARAYGAAWLAFDKAGDEAEAAEGNRRDYSDATKERLSALNYERQAAHVALLLALGVRPT